MIRGAISLIIVGFVVTNVVSLVNTRAIEKDVRALAATTLTSVELVSRMARDIDQKRLLIDAHIFEEKLANMAIAEHRIAQVDADFAIAARMYEPLATNPYERIAWERLKREIVAIHAPIEAVLERSRLNQDVEARAMMVAIEARFDAIAAAADTLIGIKHNDAARVVARIDAQQQWARYLVIGLTAGCSALACLLAAWVIRILARQDEQVRAAFALLEQRNRELDAFAGRVAHDLRGPLTTIGLSAARLGEQLPREGGTFAILERAVTRMEGVIEDLLTLSRIGGQTPGTSSNTAVVGGAVEHDLAPAVANVGGVLRVHFEPAEVTCSDGLLRQVLWNLGENAVKYRRPDVQLEIRIDGRIKDRSYELRVSDNGSGMTPHDTSQAFEPLFRSERARSIPGTGLGLSIVKRIIEAAGGTLSIDSHLGHGTSFVITLPLAGKPNGTLNELFPVPHDPS